MMKDDGFANLSQKPAEVKRYNSGCLWVLGLCLLFWIALAGVIGLLFHC
ncbi:hypothetical protein [Serratia quinivorans]|nr:hypothetical protein [Serratia quinivorans]